MLIIHKVLICPNCGQERQRFNEDEDEAIVICTQCGVPFEIGKAEEIELEW